jgi:hypothetical protein
MPLVGLIISATLIAMRLDMRKRLLRPNKIGTSDKVFLMHRKHTPPKSSKILARPTKVSPITLGQVNCSKAIGEHTRWRNWIVDAIKNAEELGYGRWQLERGGHRAVDGSGAFA